MMAVTEHDVSHVSPAGVNIFEELGFAREKAARLLAESDAEIAKMTALKMKLMTEISDWISESRLKQADAAELLHVSRPRISDVVNRKAGKFTIDTLIGMLQRIGKDVEIAVR